MRIDSHRGAAIEKSRQLTNWTGFNLGALSATDDSRHIAFLGFAHHATVYLADLRAGGSQIGDVSHFTLTDSQDYIADWAPDSKSILLVSNRTGHNALYLQALSEDTLRLVIPDARGMAQFRITPDRRWVVYLSQTGRVMRTPIDGFRPQPVLETSPGSKLSCAKLKDLCILAEPAGNGADVIVTSFSPLRGRGVELSRFNVSRAANFWAVDLSPDGNSIAELTDAAGSIRVTALDGRRAAAIALRGLENVQNVHWSATNDGLYLSSVESDGTVLWQVDSKGHTHRIWENRSATVLAALPSPNGHHLALQTEEESSNLWMLESVENPSAE